MAALCAGHWNHTTPRKVTILSTIFQEVKNTLQSAHIFQDIFLKFDLCNTHNQYSESTVAAKTV